jgi:hypothetical protein
VRKVWSRAELTERGRLFLAASVGEMPVAEACQKLGITRQRFYELEDRAVAGFLGALEPRPAGRPPKAQDPTAPLQRELHEVRKENQRLWLYVKVLRKLAGIEERGEKGGRRSKVLQPRPKADHR